MIADPVVRNRGTIGGSLCQADPAEDLSAVCTALGAGEHPQQHTAVVVAGQGHGEHEAVRAALGAGVGYIALVASKRRGAAVLDALALPAADWARVRTPAGLAIGARTAQEVALSILAEVVAAVRTPGPTRPIR